MLQTVSGLQWSNLLHGSFGETNQSELAAFTSYAMAFPNNFLALVDTYDTALSGVPNYLFVALALIGRNSSPGGIRIDSGDLSYLSLQSRELIDDLADWVSD